VRDHVVLRWRCDVTGLRGVDDAADRSCCCFCGTVDVDVDDGASATAAAPL
jgi:hypothetical protein